MRVVVDSPPGGDQPALHGERADPGEDVPAVLLVGDRRLLHAELQEQVVDVRVVPLRQRYHGSLGASGWAPPSPSIWSG